MDITFFLLSWLLLSSQVASRSLQKSSFTSFNLIHSHSIPTSLETTVYPGDRDILTDIIPSDEYLVFINLTIGVPHVPQLVVFDTGSNMIFISCTPCRNCSVAPRLFEQHRSETYATVMCDDYVCPSDCEDPDFPIPCYFRTTYANGLNASGIYGTDSLTMPTSDGGTEVITDKLIGCAHKVEYSGKSKFNGVFGFPYKPNSFLYNLGSSFSYCLGDLTNKQNSFSQLRIGNGDHSYGIQMLGDWTPLKINEGGNYRVHIEQLHFGDYYIFNKDGNSELDAVIDTASTYTALPESYVLNLKINVKEQLYKIGVKEHTEPTGNLLCFRGNLMEDLKEFPKLKIQFTGDPIPTMELDHRILFKQRTKRVFCFVVYNTIVDQGKVMIIGSVTQQNYHMAYDLYNKRLYMQKVDCQRFKD